MPNGVDPLVQSEKPPRLSPLQKHVLGVAKVQKLSR
jgi:hypothetical protein